MDQENRFPKVRPSGGHIDIGDPDAIGREKLHELNPNSPALGPDGGTIATQTISANSQIWLLPSLLLPSTLANRNKMLFLSSA